MSALFVLEDTMKRKDLWNTKEPTAFEILICDATGSTLKEVRDLEMEDFKQLLAEVLRDRNRKLRIGDLI